MDSCAFDNGEKCRALTYKDCAGCKFFKTKEALKAGRERAAKRLERLESSEREYIKHKYYIGHSAFKG